MIRHKCFTKKRNTKGSLKCTVCKWGMTDKRMEPEKMPLAAKEHVEETGHEVKRFFHSETFYGPFEGETLEIEEKPRATAYCKTCQKPIGVKATNIVLYWAAASHFKKTGHEVEITEKDGTKRQL